LNTGITLSTHLNNDCKLQTYQTQVASIPEKDVLLNHVVTAGNKASNDAISKNRKNLEVVMDL
jgi:hypothetical protein